jgi:hypothetical protein
MAQAMLVNNSPIQHRSFVSFSFRFLKFGEWRFEFKNTFPLRYLGLKICSQSYYNSQSFAFEAINYRPI